MNRLAGVALYGHEYRTLDEVAARIDAVDRTQCLEAAAYFAPERLANLELAPGQPPGAHRTGHDLSVPPWEGTK